MGSLTLPYYETYSVDVDLKKLEGSTYRLTMTKNDWTDARSKPSSTEYYLTEKQLTQLANFIMENL